MNSIEIKVYEEWRVHSLWEMARKIMESTSGQNGYEIQDNCDRRPEALSLYSGN